MPSGSGMARRGRDGMSGTTHCHLSPRKTLMPLRTPTPFFHSHCINLCLEKRSEPQIPTADFPYTRSWLCPTGGPSLPYSHPTPLCGLSSLQTEDKTPHKEQVDDEGLKSWCPEFSYPSPRVLCTLHNELWLSWEKTPTKNQFLWAGLSAPIPPTQTVSPPFLDIKILLFKDVWSSSKAIQRKVLGAAIPHNLPSAGLGEPGKPGFSAHHCSEQYGRGRDGTHSTQYMQSPTPGQHLLTGRGPSEACLLKSELASPST